MTTPQNSPVYSLPFLYKYGMILSNDATTPHTLLDVSAGQCRDSQDVIDITLGSNNPNLEGGTTSTPLILNSAINGVNGLDTGTIAVSTMYAIYAIADSTYNNQTACIITLASNVASGAGPLMPFGYDSSRVIGFWATDASGYWLAGYYSGTQNALVFTYDAPQATSVTTGAGTSYTAVDLVTLVPPINNLPILIQSNLNANAAADTLKMQGYNSTGDAVTIIAQVAGSTAHIQTVSQVLAQLNATNKHPEINYKVSSSSDAVALDVAGFYIYP